jgi:hypothetical protein
MLPRSFEGVVRISQHNLMYQSRQFWGIIWLNGSVTLIVTNPQSMLQPLALHLKHLYTLSIYGKGDPHPSLSSVI